MALRMNGPRFVQPASVAFVTIAALLLLTVNLALQAVSSSTGMYLGLCLLVLLTWAWADAFLKRALPVVHMAESEFNMKVIELCPSLATPCSPLPGLTNGHVETIFAAKTRQAPKLDYMREIVFTGDGGCVALDWELQVNLPPGAPLLILLPGLTGGSHDSYVRHAVQRAREQGIRSVVFNNRGTGDSPLLTPRFYSASHTEDLRTVVSHVRLKYPEAPLLAAGWSLGANILVKYLGEEGDSTPICTAVSMCNPFNLSISTSKLEKGFNVIYDSNLVSSLKASLAKHEFIWNRAKAEGKIDLDKAMASKTLREFDEAVTIKSFGFKSTEEYYKKSSSSLYVNNVKIPLLCIQSLNDPLAPKDAIPYSALSGNPHCILVTTKTGGHLGWVFGDGAPFGHPWSDQTMLEWFLAVLKLNEGQLSRRQAGRASSPA